MIGELQHDDPPDVWSLVSIPAWPVDKRRSADDPGTTRDDAAVAVAVAVADGADADGHADAGVGPAGRDGGTLDVIFGTNADSRSSTTLASRNF